MPNLLVMVAVVDSTRAVSSTLLPPPAGIYPSPASIFIPGTISLNWLSRIPK